MSHTKRRGKKHNNTTLYKLNSTLVAIRYNTLYVIAWNKIGTFDVKPSQYNEKNMRRKSELANERTNERRVASF